MNINRLECRERTIRASHDGTEIVRTFYCDPYEAHTVVLSALLGAVEPDPNDATKFIRRKPAEDSWFSNFYCTDAWVEQVSPEAMAASPSLGLFPPGDYTVDNFRAFISNAGAGQVPPWSYRENPGGITIRVKGDNDAKATSDAGCFIRAVFKPLIHETPTTWSSGDTGTATAPDPFDFVDPLLIPITKTITTGIGLKYLLKNFEIYPCVGSEGFVTQPMQQFTIRRLMCGKVPSITIATLKGKVNSGVFKIGGYEFPAETLRFDDCEVVKRAVPYSDGTSDRLTVWYDLLYVFTWNTIWDEYCTGAAYAGPGWVTWNRLLGVPKDGFTGFLPVKKPGDNAWFPSDAPLCYYPIGWKSSIFGDYRPLYLGDRETLGIKSGTVNGFYDLFNPVSE